MIAGIATFCWPGFAIAVVATWDVKAAICPTLAVAEAEVPPVDTNPLVVANGVPLLATARNPIVALAAHEANSVPRLSVRPEIVKVDVKASSGALLGIVSTNSSLTVEVDALARATLGAATPALAVTTGVDTKDAGEVEPDDVRESATLEVMFHSWTVTVSPADHTGDDALSVNCRDRFDPRVTVAPGFTVTRALNG